MGIDLVGARRCWQPRHWFNGDGEPDPFVVREEDVFMWVYRGNNDGGYEVGYFAPDGAWFPESSHATAALASERVNYLNGGKRVL